MIVVTNVYFDEDDNAVLEYTKICEMTGFRTAKRAVQDPRNLEHPTIEDLGPA